MIVYIVRELCALIGTDMCQCINDSMHWMLNEICVSLLFQHNPDNLFFFFFVSV